MQKCLIRVSAAAVAAALCTSMCCAAASAAEDGGKLTVTDGNSIGVQKGDTVKYSLYVSECAESLVGVDMSLFYSEDSLKIDEESVTYDSLDGVVSNPALPGQVRFNWTSITDPVQLTADRAFVSAEFEVTSDDGGEISYFVTDMYSDDLTYLKSYRITCSVSVNGTEVCSQSVPIVNETEASENKLQGDFINYVDGRGEDDVEGSDRKTVIVEKKYITTEVVDVTKTVTEASGSGSSMTIIIIVAAAVILLAIAAVIIVKQRDDKHKSGDGSSDERGSSGDGE